MSLLFRACLLMTTLPALASPPVELTPSWIHSAGLKRGAELPIVLHTPNGISLVAPWNRLDSPLGPGVQRLDLDLGLAFQHLPGRSPRVLRAVDLNGDGFDELLQLDLDGLRWRDPLTGAQLGSIELPGLAEDFLLGDLDGDGAPEVLLRSGTLVSRHALPSGALEAQVAILPGTTLVAALQADGDDALEIALSNGQVLDGLDFANEPLWAPVDAEQAFVVDVEGDGIDELVVYSFPYWTLESLAEGRTRWTIFGSSDTPDGDAVLADTDGDGALELAIGGRDPYSGIDRRIAVHDLETGLMHTEQVVGGYGLSSEMLAAVDRDGDGGDELLFVDYDDLWSFDAVSGTLEPLLLSGLRGGGTVVVDLDADGTAELVTGADSGGLSVWDPITGALESTARIDQAAAGATMGPFDDDGDGRDSVFLGGPYRYLVQPDAAGELVATRPARDAPRDFDILVASVDVDGDGRDDLVAAGEAQIWLYDGGLEADRWRLDLPGLTDAELADVDADGTPELLVTSSTGLQILDGLTGQVERSFNGNFQHVAAVSFGGPFLDVVTLDAGRLTRFTLQPQGWVRGAPWTPAPGVTQIRGERGYLLWTDATDLYLVDPRSRRRMVVRGAGGDLRATASIADGVLYVLDTWHLGAYPLTR